jgi:hypothetical protein
MWTRWKRSSANRRNEFFAQFVHATAGAGFLLAREFFDGKNPATPAYKRLSSSLLGIAVAAPFLLLFGMLFAAADASFEQLAGRLFDVDLSSLFIHLVITGSVAWIAAGFLRGSLLADEVPPPAALGASFFSLGITEVGVALGLLDMLFLLFVVPQIPYLFGGATTVADTAALTYAGYSRRGFFELTAVTCCAIATLLLADWILLKDSRRAVMLFRSLAGLNLLLLGVIMASAWERLLLYQALYGLTEARLYAAAALTGMGLVSLWFVFSVLPGRRDRFAFGSIVSAYAVVLALDFINPDALIARIDLARASEGKRFDVKYLLTLSTDATPELISGIPRVQASAGALISQQLVRSNDTTASQDWRTWNFSRSRASKAIRTNLEALTAAGNIISGSR